MHISRGRRSYQSINIPYHEVTVIPDRDGILVHSDNYDREEPVIGGGMPIVILPVWEGV